MARFVYELVWLFCVMFAAIPLLPLLLAILVVFCVFVLFCMWFGIVGYARRLHGHARYTFLGERYLGVLEQGWMVVDCCLSHQQDCCPHCGTRNAQ